MKISLTFLGRRKINPAGANQSESNSVSPHHDTCKFCRWLQAVGTADQRWRRAVFSPFLPSGVHRLTAWGMLRQQQQQVLMSVVLQQLN